jgi:hypothetical protein
LETIPPSNRHIRPPHPPLRLRGLLGTKSSRTTTTVAMVAMVAVVSHLILIGRLVLGTGSIGPVDHPSGGIGRRHRAADVRPLRTPRRPARARPALVLSRLWAVHGAADDREPAMKPLDWAAEEVPSELRPFVLIML